MAVVEDAVYARLIGYSALTALLPSTTHVWPVAARQGVAAPYVVFNVIGDENTHAMGVDITPNEARVEVTVISASYGEMVDVGVQAKAALSRYSGTSGGVVVQDILYTGVSADIIDVTSDYYQRSMDFQVFYEE